MSFAHSFQMLRVPDHMTLIEGVRRVPVFRRGDIHDARTFTELKTALRVETAHTAIGVDNPSSLLKDCTSELRSSATGKRRIFFVEIGDRLVGYLDVHPAPDEEVPGIASFNLAILKEWWGFGIGSQLVAMGEFWARRQSFDFIIILVGAGNYRASALYERLGYSVCGHRAGETDGIAGTSEAHVMGRILASSDHSR